MIFIIGMFFTKIKGIKLTPEFISTVGYHILRYKRDLSMMTFEGSSECRSAGLRPFAGTQPAVSHLHENITDYTIGINKNIGRVGNTAACHTVCRYTARQNLFLLRKGGKGETDPCLRKT
jgi:hypothetical protein